MTIAATAFQYNSVDVSTYGVILDRSQDQPLPDIFLDRQDLGGRDGAVIQAAKYIPRFWSWNFAIKGSSFADAVSKMDSLKLLLDSRQGARVLIPGYNQARQINAVINGPINGTWKSSGFHGQLNWMAPDPFFYATSAAGQSNTAIITNPATVYEPTTAGQSVAGTELARPVYTIKTTGIAAVSQVQLQNVTRSEVMVVNVSLAQNNLLRIDCDRMVVEKSTDNGASWIGAMTGVTIASRFPLLTAGVRNQLTVTGIAAGTITIAYRAAYL